jgi:Na+-transporting NADH:ubiquinone oxidoreductase subunit NqrC
MIGKTNLENKKMREEKNTRKAQIEMIGLVIIVIIIITALLIFLAYRVTRPQQTIKKTYVNAEIANNMLLTMTKTNIGECHNMSLADLLTDCTRGYYSINCFDYTSCQVANDTIKEILARTLDEWNLSYNLEVEGADIKFSTPDCDSGDDEKVQAFEILPLNPGQIEMILDICIN